LTRYGHGFNLDGCTFRQSGGLDGGTSRGCVREELSVNPIHPPKIIHVLEKYGGFNDQIQGRAGGLENIAQVEEGLAGLGLDPTWDQLAGVSVHPKLSRREHEVTDPDSDGVRADGFGRFLSDNFFFFWHLHFYLPSWPST
jgi:hypothetical protein